MVTGTLEYEHISSKSIVHFSPVVDSTVANFDGCTEQLAKARSRTISTAGIFMRAERTSITAVTTGAKSADIGVGQRSSYDVGIDRGSMPSVCLTVNGQRILFAERPPLVFVRRLKILLHTLLI